MALDAQLMLVGERHGLLTGPGSAGGSSTLSQTEVPVFYTSHEIVAPRSPSSGLPTGKRHHKPLLVRRVVTGPSMGIRQAFVDNENLTEVRLRYFQPAFQGGAKQYFTIQLFNANISSIKTMLPYTRAVLKANAAFTKGNNLLLWEELSFTYLRIQWTWNDPPRSDSDDWLAAR